MTQAGLDVMGAHVLAQAAAKVLHGECLAERADIVLFALDRQ